MSVVFIRKWLKKALVVTARNSLVQEFFCNLNRRNVVFLGYHGVRRDNDVYEAWTLVRESDFHAQMTFLKKRFECLSIDEALQDGGNRTRPAVCRNLR